MVWLEQTRSPHPARSAERSGVITGGAVRGSVENDAATVEAVGLMMAGERWGGV